MQPNTRENIPQGFFLLIGVAITSIAVLTRIIGGTTWSLISDISLNIGITVLAVSIIDWIWRRLGGDPLMIAINELRSATILLSDLRDTGIKRFFISRERASERRQYFKARMTGAFEVDMMGIALRSGWISDPAFQKTLEERVSSGNARFRIVVLDPESPITTRRAFEEDRVKDSKRISETASETLRILLEIRNRLPAERQESLSIKVIDETNIYCSVIRVDNQMLVTNYHVHLTGGNSELLELEGKDNTLFKIYWNEFNTMWERAAEWPKQMVST